VTRPQYRGAHSDLTGMSQNTTLPKIILFSRLHFFDLSEIKECVQYSVYLRDCAKFLAIFFSVLRHYHGAHSYLASISQNSSLLNLIFLREALNSLHCIRIDVWGRPFPLRTSLCESFLICPQPHCNGIFRKERYYRSSRDRSATGDTRTGTGSTYPSVPPPYYLTTEVTATTYYRRG